MKGGCNCEGSWGARREEGEAGRGRVRREQRRKERLEKEVRELKGKLDAKQQELRVKTAATAAAEEQVHRMEQLLRESQVPYQTPSPFFSSLFAANLKLRTICNLPRVCVCASAWKRALLICSCPRPRFPFPSLPTVSPATPFFLRHVPSTRSSQLPRSFHAETFGHLLRL